MTVLFSSPVVIPLFRYPEYRPSAPTGTTVPNPHFGTTAPIGTTAVIASPLILISALLPLPPLQPLFIPPLQPLLALLPLQPLIPHLIIFCIFMPTNSIFCFTFLTIWFIMGISADDEREFFFVSKRGIRQKSTLMIT